MNSQIDLIFRGNVNSESDLLSLAEDLNIRYFTHYYPQQEIKENQFQAALDYLQIDIANKSIIDIGPGTGDSLQLAKKLGATKTVALDVNPFFVKLALIRGHSSYMKNYTVSRDRLGKRVKFFPPEIENYDFVYSKGSLNCDLVNQGRGFGVRKAIDLIKGFDFQSWVDEFKSLVKSGGDGLFIPAPPKQDEWFEDTSYPIKTDYWVRDAEEWENSYFSKILIDSGFTVISEIPGLTHEKAFPRAYHYKG